MQYQVAFVSLDDEPYHYTMDSWSEVQEWVSHFIGDHPVREWNVSLVVESSNGEHVKDPSTHDEMAQWFDNLVSLMPKDLTTPEVLATLCAIADKYWDTAEMAHHFKSMSAMLSGLEKEEGKPSVH